MIYKFEYKTDTDRQNVVTANATKFLVEEQNIAEGSFLIFSDISTLEGQVAELKVGQEATNAMVDFLAMTMM